MQGAADLLRKYGIVLLAFGWLLSVLFAVTSADRAGSRRATAAGDKALAELRLEYAQQALQVERDHNLQLLQQVERANQAEQRLLGQQDQHTADAQQIEERIPHVTTNYRPAPTAPAVAIPRCVFTAGWLRDYNLALGVPAPGTASAAPGSPQTPWAAPGSDAERLESGATPADILAHAKDYGRWARDNLAQLNALLDLQNKD